MTTEPVTSFAQMALAPPLLQSIEEVGYEAPSPIQSATIPVLLDGRDLLGQAQTGTGKTAAFALPLLSRLDLSMRQTQVLVLTPTRELAIQVAEAMQTYARHLKGFHILPIYGGQSVSIQLRQLRRGVHVVVGTPGRVMDHLRRGTLKLDTLQAVVLDEADEMLRMGFIDDVEWILEQTPKQRQVALFSATLPPVIARVAKKHLNNPVDVKIKAKTATVEATNQRFWQVSGLHKLDALTRILEAEPFEAILIFVRTKKATEELAEKLEARGFTSSALNGDMNQMARERTVDRLRKGALDILVATDVAARGLDVERISHVINYDIPYDTESYIHRIGRTGRAGRKGEAILFVSPREKRMLRAIERATRQSITPMKIPSRKQITGRRVDRFKELITQTLESQELGFFEQMVDGFQTEHDIGMSEIAAALAYLAQRDRPLRIDEASIGKIDEQPAAFGKSAPRGRAPSGPFDRLRADGPRAGKPSKPRDRDHPDLPMDPYRIEVGREHNVEPGNIVGAIANEAGIESAFIGRIRLFDTYSTVDLPQEMPKEIFQHLKRVWVCGRQLQITRLGKPQKSYGSPEGGKPRKPKDSKKPRKSGKPKTIKPKPPRKRDRGSSKT